MYIIVGNPDGYIKWDLQSYPKATPSHQQSEDLKMCKNGDILMADWDSILYEASHSRLYMGKGALARFLASKSSIVISQITPYY